MELHRLENPGGDTTQGGVLCVFADRSAIELGWKRDAPVTDTLRAAKDLAARLIERLLAENRGALVDSLNVPSVVAALQRHVMDWNEARRAALYAQPGPSAADLATERHALGLPDPWREAQRADSGHPAPGGEPPLH